MIDQDRLPAGYQQRSLRARRDLVMALSNFLGARWNERKGHLWLTSHLSPDSELENADSLFEIMRRADDLLRSDSYAAGSARTFANHIIGSGLPLQAQVTPITGLINARQANVLNDELEDFWSEWCEQADPWSGQHLHDLEWTAALQWKVKGEAFLIESSATSFEDPSRVVPLGVQLIEPERVDTPPFRAGDPACRLGIQRDRPGGRITGYWVRKVHPGDTMAQDPESWDFVRRDRMHHLFDQLWPGQSRGTSAYVAALEGTKDLDTFVSAELEAKLCEALFSGFAEEARPGTLPPTAEKIDNVIYEDIYPGTIKKLPPGYTMTFANPTRPGSNFAPFFEAINRRNAVGIGMPYEWYAGDWTGVTYSSGRLSEITGATAVMRDQAKFKRVIKAPLYRRFVLELSLKRTSSVLTLAKYQSRPRAFTRSDWITAARPDIDQTKDAGANVIAREKFYRPLSDIMGREGKDWEVTLRQYFKELRVLQELAGQAGISLPGITEPIDEQGEMDKARAVIGHEETLAELEAEEASVR